MITENLDKDLFLISLAMCQEIEELEVLLSHNLRCKTLLASLVRLKDRYRVLLNKSL